MNYLLPPAPTPVLVDGPAPTYAARLTLAQRIVNAGIVRWRFCLQEHEATRALKQYERSHGFTTISAATFWKRRRQYLRDVLAHDPGHDPDWWLAREWMLERDADWLRDQRDTSERLTTDAACALFAERTAA